jgi:hypothetical protein
MNRSLSIAAIIFAVLSAPIAQGQETDDPKILKAQLEASKAQFEAAKAKLEAANLKIEKLQREIDQLKAAASNQKGTGEKDKVNKRLVDLVAVGTTITGDYRFRAGDQSSGNWSITIKEINGKKITGTYTVKKLRPTEGPGNVVDFEGTLEGNSITFNPVNTTTMNFTARGLMNKEGQIKITFNGRAGIADMTAKVKE